MCKPHLNPQNAGLRVAGCLSPTRPFGTERGCGAVAPTDAVARGMLPTARTSFDLHIQMNASYCRRAMPRLHQKTTVNLTVIYTVPPSAPRILQITNAGPIATMPLGQHNAWPYRLCPRKWRQVRVLVARIMRRDHLHRGMLICSYSSSSLAWRSWGVRLKNCSKSRETN